MTTARVPRGPRTVAPVRGDRRSRRRTQQARRAATRGALLDATVACLVQRGWAGTSTTEIARMAGVSRGAQQHHYRSKHELVAAAVEHLLTRQREAYERAFTGLPPAERTAPRAVDLLWEMFRGPYVTALLELAVAGRTDPLVRPMCAAIVDRIAALTIETFDRIFPGAPSRERAPAVLRGLLALLTGLALTRGLDEEIDRSGDEVLEQVRALAAVLFPVAPRLRRPPATTTDEGMP
jgi:AcrR family transcriptional regulator